MTDNNFYEDTTTSPAQASSGQPASASSSSSPFRLFTSNRQKGSSSQAGGLGDNSQQRSSDGSNNTANASFATDMVNDGSGSGHGSSSGRRGSKLKFVSRRHSGGKQPPPSTATTQHTEGSSRVLGKDVLTGQNNTGQQALPVQGELGNSNSRKSGFIRSLLGQRANDYRSDATAGPQQQQPQIHHTSVEEIKRRSFTGDHFAAAAQQQTEDHDSAANTTNPKRRCCSNIRSCSELTGATRNSCISFKSLFQCNKPSGRTLGTMQNVIKSKFWSFGILFFTVLLLAGAQVQELWIPKEGDIVFDILFSIAFVMLLADVVMRSFVEPSYYNLQLWGCFNRRGGGNTDTDNNNNNRNIQQKSSAAAAWGSCRLGSFMFWCDVISTMFLLYDISYINKASYDLKAINIGVNDYGVPVSGVNQINRAIPVNLQKELFVVIGRTVRVARFIRASTVVKASSRINWYLLVQLLNPLWYIERCRRRRRNGKEESSLFESNDKQPRSSWGNLSATTLAYVQASAHTENQTKQKGVRGAVSKLLNVLGLRETEKETLEKQIRAAIKIQRCYRNNRARLQAYANADTDHWEFQNNSEMFSSNTFEKVGGSSSTGLMNNQRSNFGKNIRRSVEMMPATVKNKVMTRNAAGKIRQESQVGSAMRELTGQRVAVGIFMALILTVLFTYSEDDATRPSTMIVLHSQTNFDTDSSQVNNDKFSALALDAARDSSVPDMFYYDFGNTSKVGEEIDCREGPFYDLDGDYQDPEDLRDREILRVTVSTVLQVDSSNNATRVTTGCFSYRDERQAQALVELLSTIFMMIIWFFGVTAFAGPVMTLVVIPIERMVKLLGMLMVDPLGYQSTSRYKTFVAEEDRISKNSQWTKDVLKGMETSFLMSTILRIGSLMKVGFGSAGVEIIRNNLEKGQKKDTLFLNSQGTTVACIFLFCDIRQFTDATESLQEEVFIFTNKIGAVVHSLCHSLGGSANKNVGDAFLLSWLLDDDNLAKGDTATASGEAFEFSAKHNQADKALLSVVRISMALHHDNYYLESMSETARDALLAKLSKRKGPVVQMGFGLHAGKAIQGALGSQRKIDATYVSESVERAEFLESSTKKYGVKMLMSDNFYRLLYPNNRRRCRKVDQILINNEEDAESGETIYEGEIMNLYTFDMDIDALWRNEEKGDNASDTESINDSSIRGSRKKNSRFGHDSRDSTGMLKQGRRRSVRQIILQGGNLAGLDSSDEMGVNSSRNVTKESNLDRSSVSRNAGESGEEKTKTHSAPELVLPSGPMLYNANVWLSEEMRKIRHRYSDGLFFQKFSSGLQSYYNKDWEDAKRCFQTILNKFEDGPSQYFLDQIDKNNGVPPRHFKSYGTE